MHTLVCIAACLEFGSFLRCIILESPVENEWDNVACLPIVDISKNYKDEIVGGTDLEFVTDQQLTDYVLGIEIDPCLPVRPKLGSLICRH